jgi:hypothetical protein
MGCSNEVGLCYKTKGFSVVACDNKRTPRVLVRRRVIEMSALRHPRENESDCNVLLRGNAANAQVKIRKNIPPKKALCASAYYSRPKSGFISFGIISPATNYFFRANLANIVALL